MAELLQIKCFLQHLGFVKRLIDQVLRQKFFETKVQVEQGDEWGRAIRFCVTVETRFARF